MATTPEGWVKKAVKALLEYWRDYDYFPGHNKTGRLYYHMPVQNGMGKPSLDFIICTHGQFLAVETKAPGKHLTARQQQIVEEIQAAEGQVVIVSSWAGLELLWQKVSDSRSGGPGPAWPPIEMPADLEARWMRYFRNAGCKDAHQSTA